MLAIDDPTATCWSAVRKAPSLEHLMGTDEIGRDVFSRMIWGARDSLIAGVISVIMAVSLRVPRGLVAGSFGGWIDQIISRLTAAMMRLTFLIIAIGLAAFMGSSMG